MPNDPDPVTQGGAVNQPAPEELRTEAETASHMQNSPAAADTTGKQKLSARLRRVTYRPSHKATFVGIAVVVVVLALNIGVIAYLMRSQDGAKTKAAQEGVTINSEVLESLGVSRSPVTNQGTELVVGPNSKFNGKVTIAGDTTMSGQLQLNSKISASEASLARLQAGNTALSQLDVNGDSNVSNLNVRRDLTIAGATRFQGTVLITQLLTVNNNANVAGSLSVGGTLSVRNFQASSLTSDTTLTIGGHVITRGDAPGASAGPAVGSNGTVSISGSDAAGTVAVNTGIGAGNGVLATITFNRAYTGTPRIVMTPVGLGGNYYINRSANGFSIAVSGALPPAGIAFDYIVMQ